ncbi:retinal pigment epithelial membrane protein-domain-containing protein [Geopyxis carbonaria]|nr:retinal pigment epithelial membrane protein-domain-containing protein [Geopyxis carbonaria]
MSQAPSIAHPGAAPNRRAHRGPVKHAAWKANRKERVYGSSLSGSGEARRETSQQQAGAGAGTMDGDTPATDGAAENEQDWYEMEEGREDDEGGRGEEHPFLTNPLFAPTKTSFPLTACAYSGTIPTALAGGQYVRNGSNPVQNEDLGRDAHWFDVFPSPAAPSWLWKLRTLTDRVTQGDGMLHGVLFAASADNGGIVPQYVNSYIQTDLYLSSTTSSTSSTSTTSATSSSPSRPLPPSITTLLSTHTSLFSTLYALLRAALLVFWSHLRGRGIRRIGVANTSIYWHDGRALAGGESGPPMRVLLPGLETVGWFDGLRAEGEPVEKWREGGQEEGGRGGFGTQSMLPGVRFMREWTTAHPKLDPDTGELLAFHCCPVAPYITYSVLPSTFPPCSPSPSSPSIPSSPGTALINAPLPGLDTATLTHDFAATPKYTIIPSLPLHLSPLHHPPLYYDPTGVSRFGVFPRHHPECVQWFEHEQASVVFHTAAAWDEGEVVHMLAPRMTSASILYIAGNIPAPVYDGGGGGGSADKCELTHYTFNPRTGTMTMTPLWSRPFEFPATAPRAAMRRPEWVYGATLSQGSFGVRLGGVDAVAKVHVSTLLRDSYKNNDESRSSSSSGDGSGGGGDGGGVEVLRLPPGCTGQEPCFVPDPARAGEEDGGWILVLVARGWEARNEPAEARAEGQAEGEKKQQGEEGAAQSELWIIDAQRFCMDGVVARVHLPQRVPAGFHGSWFGEEKVGGQRPVGALRG